MAVRAGRLGVIRDGVSLPEEQARALWRAFSEHLDRNEGDLEGFARAHGFASVRPEHRRGRAVLVVVSSLASLPPPSRRSAAASSAPAESNGRAPPNGRLLSPRKTRPSGGTLQAAGKKR